MQPQDLVLDPEKILKQCNISTVADVADFGCGPGIFSIPLARMTSGTVFCFDVLESALEAVKNRAYVMGLTNIVTHRSNLEKMNGSGLGDASVSHVVMRKILLQNDDKNVLFEESHRVLVTGGTLLIVGWTGEVAKGFGAEESMSPDQIVALADQTGFSRSDEIDAGKYHFAYVFTK